MTQALRHLFRHDDGQDLVEYALLTALLAIACITAILELTRIQAFLAAAGAALDAAI